jgi:glycosyltransferase involved in cell wall biosynthesis
MVVPKILHVSTWQTPCGIATYCENLVKSLERVGVRNEVFPLHPSEWIDWLPQDIAKWQADLLDAARGCDLVHIQHEHGLFGYALGQKFACKRFGGILSGLATLKIPVVTTFHTDLQIRQSRKLSRLFSRFRKRRMWQRYAAQFFGVEPGKCRAIVHSMRTRKSFVKHGFPADSISTIIHPCLSPRTHKHDNATAKEALGLPPKSRLITLFGFVGRYKGHDIAVNALTRLPGNYHLAIVGGAHPESKDQFLSKLLDSIPVTLRSRVFVTGWVAPETADFYFSATDICIAPYRGDTELSGSGAITWPLSSGRPVIASKIDAFQSVNRQGECMFMFTPDCESELAWAIQKVDSDEALRTRLVNQANEFCRRHSWDAKVENILEIYSHQGLNFEECDVAAPARRAA